MSRSSSPAGGFTLETIALRGDRDVVSLSRRTRSAAEEFGLRPREVRSLSAATFEVARQLVTRGDVSAELRLAEGPSLQVVFRVPVASHERTASVRRDLEAAVEPLQALVDRVDLSERKALVCLSLRSNFRAETASPAAREPERAPVVPAPAPPAAGEDLRQRHRELQQQLQELQQELHDTNSGVIALHSELEANADRLRHAEDRLRLLLDSVQDYAICMLTPEGEITSWNAGAERLFGCAADEMVGRHFGIFYPEPDRESGVPAADLRDAEERGRLVSEGPRVRHGGAAFDAHVVLTPVRRGRELRGFSLVVRDVTERKRLEDDLRRRAEDLAAANRAKEEFLATLSHELRTPLNAMLGWTRLLRMGKLDPAAMARALETIERNAHIQEQLIADILDVSRIVTGKLRMELRLMELAPIVEAAVDAVRPAAQAKGIELLYRGEDGVWVLGDPDRLQQVVWNLLVNAIKFTPPSGTVVGEITRDAASAVVTVTDTGEGIQPALLPYVFDRFTQGDGSVTRPHGGLGLGLSIVRHIVELHGGKVLAASEGPGRGARFAVHLPVQARDASASRAALS